jgi:hypothetical protein
MFDFFQIPSPSPSPSAPLLSSCPPYAPLHSPPPPHPHQTQPVLFISSDPGYIQWHKCSRRLPPACAANCVACWARHINCMRLLPPLLLIAFCLTHASQSARVIIGEDRLGQGLSKGETKRDMRRGVYMHTVRFEPAVPGSSRIPHDPLSHPTCARQIQITRCFPSPPCRRTPPTYTRQPNPAVDGNRLKQSDFCAGVLGKGNDTYGESRVARAGGRTVLLHSYQPLARAM